MAGQQNHPVTIPADFPIFSGRIDDDTHKHTSTAWFQLFERLFARGTNEADKIYYFELSLATSSPADDWFTAVPPTDKDTWPKIKALFHTKWPAVANTEASIPARRAAMWEIKLSEEELGKMEGEKRNRVYTHVGWANKVEAIWETLGDTNGHLLDSIRHNIPQALIFMMNVRAEDENDGAKFFTAVRNVQIEKVLGKAKESAAMRDLEERVAAMTGLSVTQHTAFPSHAGPDNNHRHTYVPQAQQQPYSPQHGTSPQPPPPNQHQPAQRSTHEVPPHQRAPGLYAPMTPSPYVPRQQLPTPMQSSPNPFGDINTPRQSAFAQRLMNTPASPSAGRDSTYLARQAVTNSTPFADDQAGREAYAVAAKAWEDLNGMGMCTFLTTLLPLSPGTDRLGASECYRCGKASQPPHRGVDCVDVNRIPVKEAQWRSYVTKFLQGNRNNFATPGRNPGIARIAVTDDGIAYDTQLYPGEALTFVDNESSGNGQESR